MENVLRDVSYECSEIVGVMVRHHSYDSHDEISITCQQ